MQPNHSPVELVALPTASMLQRIYRTVNLADAYAIDVPSTTISDPEALARFVFASAPPWVTSLMAMRDTVVAGLGLKTSGSLRLMADPPSGPRVGIFQIYELAADEIVIGEDDKHLDFRVSIRYEPRNNAAESSPRVVMSTVVRCHNLLGRSYLRVIEPIHRAVVKSFLRRAARMGWPLHAPI